MNDTPNGNDDKLFAHSFINSDFILRIYWLVYCCCCLSACQWWPCTRAWTSLGYLDNELQSVGRLGLSRPWFFIPTEGGTYSSAHATDRTQAIRLEISVAYLCTSYSIVFLSLFVAAAMASGSVADSDVWSVYHHPEWIVSSLEDLEKYVNSIRRWLLLVLALVLYRTGLYFLLCVSHLSLARKCLWMIFIYHNSFQTCSLILNKCSINVLDFIETLTDYARYK